MKNSGSEMSFVFSCYSFSVMTVNAYNLFTPDTTAEYSTTWLKPVHGDRWLSFKVRACSDANFALMLSDGTSDPTLEYEVVFGGEENTRTFISKAGTTVASVDSVNILDCGSFREFWVRWQGDLIEAGMSGHVGSNRIVHYAETDPRGVDLVSLSTGNGHGGEWVFHVYSGE